MRLFRKSHPLWNARRVLELSFCSGLGDSAWLLYGLVRALKPQIAVEIGSAQGKSACYIGAALKDNGGGKLVAIDPHCPTAWNDTGAVDSFSTMQSNLRRARVQDFVEIRRQFSSQAAGGWELPIDFLFLDGDHTYEGVKRDWEAFSPFVTKSGIVVFHDTAWEFHRDNPCYRPDMGVPRFVEELRATGFPVVTSFRDFGLSLVQPVVGGVPFFPLTQGHSACPKAAPSAAAL